jgi:hypothetical protein
MKPISCMYITGGLVTVLVISLYFAYVKKQEEIQELARARAEAEARAKTKEHFRGGGGESLHYGGGGTEGSAADSVSPSEYFRGGGGGVALHYGGGGTAGGPAAEYASVSSSCSSDADCGFSRRCGSTGFCV